MTTTPEPTHGSDPTWADVLELVTTLDAGSYADVDLQMSGLRLRMSTTARAFGDDPATPTPAPSAGTAAPAAAPEQGTAAPAAAEPEPVATAESAPGSTVDVVAPMLGIFYRRPAPDAPPFVEPGDAVEPDTTVGIIEVMKLMNPVTAGVAGRVLEVGAADGDLVEHGDTLFRVEPATAP